MSTGAVWLLLLLGTTGRHLTEQVSLQPPVHVRFSSVDYKTSVLWAAPSNSSALKYHVQWKIYGEPRWVDVDHCQGTKSPQCSLSHETSVLTEWYYARVRATSSTSQSDWVVSPRFSPRWDSVISVPVLRVNATRKGIVVRVKPPLAQVRRNHRDLYYKIYLRRGSRDEEELEMKCCFHKLNIQDVTRRKTYCFQAQTILPLQARRSNRSPAKCITFR
ncbi:unnamed protein product [Knipowitschia caucasica]